MNRQNIILVASAAIATALAMLAVPAIGQLANQAPTPAVSGPSPDPAPQDRVVPESAMAVQQSYAPVVKRTSPAVVNVYSSVNITRSDGQAGRNAAQASHGATSTAASTPIRRCRPRRSNSAR